MAEKRSIFQEVDAPGAVPTAASGGMIDAQRRGARRGIRLWLMALFALVVLMIAVGGLTRLVPLTGITLPLVSYGGSSLIANHVLLALLLRIDDARPRPERAAAPSRDAEVAA